MHSGRRKSREIALQVLFLWDANNEKDEELALRVAESANADGVVSRRAMELAAGAWDQRAACDARVENVAPQWPPRRQPGVDRAVIRMAVWEMTGTDTPPKVIIDEAIELAREFSTEQSPAFVNGVLDAVLREHRELLREKPAAVLKQPAIAQAAQVGVQVSPGGEREAGTPEEAAAEVPDETLEGSSDGLSDGRAADESTSGVLAANEPPRQEPPEP